MLFAWFITTVAVLLAVLIGLSRARQSAKMARLEKRLADAQSQARATRAELLDSILVGLGDACLLLSPDGEILFANEEACHFFDTTASLTGRRVAQVLPDQRILNFFQNALERKSGYAEDEFRVIFHPRGRTEERILRINAAPAYLKEDATEKQLRIIISDETRRHETEQIRKDFVANASHELRTPLSIINGYLENLLEGVIDEPEVAKKSLVTMQKHGERLARIVEDMLTISKFESADDRSIESLRGQQFSCRTCVENVIERLTPLIEAKRARVTLDFPAGADEIMGDQFYWDQIFFNLIENALKENQDDGRLQITISMHYENDSAVIKVRDNGVGIPREDLPFVFKRFFRVAKHHSQQIKGTGLGLSIVKRAVEAHGGTISLDSSPNVKTEFTILLPREPVAKVAVQ